MKHRKPIFILLIVLAVLQIFPVRASADYTGPDSGARRYSYVVPGTCKEEYSCCSWWSEESCGTNEWNI